tara:strand:+ start:361 stop:552 length:192 start_codon:yes stop_codon:yes gene_type:complete
VGGLVEALLGTPQAVFNAELEALHGALQAVFVGRKRLTRMLALDTALQRHKLHLAALLEECLG